MTCRSISVGVSKGACLLLCVSPLVARCCADMPPRGSAVEDEPAAPAARSDGLRMSLTGRVTFLLGATTCGACGRSRTNSVKSKGSRRCSKLQIGFQKLGLVQSMLSALPRNDIIFLILSDLTDQDLKDLGDRQVRRRGLSSPGLLGLGVRRDQCGSRESVPCTRTCRAS